MKKQKESRKKAEGKKIDEPKAVDDAEPSHTNLGKDISPQEAESPVKEFPDVNTTGSDGLVNPETLPTRTPHGRQPSLSIQSKLRSSSFRRTSGSQAPLSPTANGSKSQGLPALSPEGDAVTEIYRKQAFRIDELERENKRLAKEAETSESRWRKIEEEVEELRENSGQVAKLKSQAEKSDAKAEEITRLVKVQPALSGSLC